MAGQSSPVFRTTAFRISCWSLGVLAFAEVLSAAVALAARIEATHPVEVRYVDREVKVPQIIRVPVPTAVAPPVIGMTDRQRDAGEIVSSPPQVDPPPAPKKSEPAPNPLGAPAIADPVVERLVLEARKARVAGDNMLSVTKLNEAATITPDEPNVEYELGLVHESMGVFDTASDHYQKVFSMGAGKAGTLYELAGAKLRDGLGEPDAHGTLALGRTRIFRDVNYPDGERIVLTIPVQTAPGAVINNADLSVQVLFFDKVKDKDVVPRADGSSTTTQDWVTTDSDRANGEQLLRVTYIIPKQSEQTEHLFGHRAYYGQSVELTYKNELVDVQAWPRDLAARSQQFQNAAPQQAYQQPRPNNGLPGPGDVPPEFLKQDEMPPGFDKNVPLLPKLPSR